MCKVTANRIQYKKNESENSFFCIVEVPRNLPKVTANRWIGKEKDRFLCVGAALWSVSIC